MLIDLIMTFNYCTQSVQNLQSTVIMNISMTTGIQHFYSVSQTHRSPFSSRSNTLFHCLSVFPRRLWQTVNKLLHRQCASPLPSFTSSTSLADSFASFFTHKMDKLCLSLAAISSALCPHTPSPPVTPPQFSTFKPATAPSLPLVSPHVVSSWFCSRSASIHHVHDPTQYSHFISLFKPSPLCWRYTTFSLLLPI